MRAARDRKLRTKLAVHNAAVRVKIASLIETKAAALGDRLPASAQDIAAVALALADGFARQGLAAAPAPGDDALHASMLARLFGIDASLTTADDRGRGSRWRRFRICEPCATHEPSRGDG
jgi:hypothetical protein